MELERMGFDLGLLAYVSIGISFLIIATTFLATYFSHVIKKWRGNRL